MPGRASADQRQGGPRGRLDRSGGYTVLNLYKPPVLPRRKGDPELWLEHAYRIYGNDVDHVLRWLAHRVQRPHEKINHALVLGGAQGIGKDTLLEPVKQAIGPWNFTEASPQQALGRFNGFLKSVILRINEARDLGEFNRYALYDHTKAFLASPPDTLRIDEKNRQEYAIFNVLAAVITTNHKADGIFLPEDDRRHFVAWSDRTKADFNESYWRRIWHWYEHGGYEIVANYLATLDLSGFNPKEPPPKTQAFWRSSAPRARRKTPSCRMRSSG